MSGKSKVDTTPRTGHRTKAELVRRATAMLDFKQGMPTLPSDPRLRGNHRLMEIWRDTARRLDEAHKLAVSDGRDALVAFSQAQLAGNLEAARLIVAAVWANRPPFAVTGI